MIKKYLNYYINSIVGPFINIFYPIKADVTIIIIVLILYNTSRFNSDVFM